MKMRTGGLARMRVFGMMLLASLMMAAETSSAQNNSARSYPKEIRGYKVERTVIEIKKPESKNGKPSAQNASPNDGQTVNQPPSDSDVDALIQFGEPQLARVTPLGITSRFRSSWRQLRRKAALTFSCSKT